jgi:hypothetical protein
MMKNVILSMISFNQEEKQIWILKLYGKNEKSFLRLDEIVLSERLKKTDLIYVY